MDIHPKHPNIHNISKLPKKCKPLTNFKPFNLAGLKIMPNFASSMRETETPNHLTPKNPIDLTHDEKDRLAKDMAHADVGSLYKSRNVKEMLNS